nr:hypothetical protein [Tanacetum cinerariifolium]
ALLPYYQSVYHTHGSTKSQIPFDAKGNNTTIAQVVGEALGYNYVIAYKKGRENVAADALSRVQGTALFTTAISHIEPLLFDRIMESQNKDVEVQHVIQKLKNEEILPRFKWNGKWLVKENRMVVGGNRLTKYAHFVLLGHPFSAKDVAQVFIDNIYKLHGCPNSIISDRDPIFLSSFWTKFLNLQGVSAKLSTAYHPQTDGQTKVVNRCLEGYLRCTVMERPFTWTKWLSLAEWWYNTSFHSPLGRTPFEALYGYRPPLHIPYIPRDVADQDVDELMRYREAAIKVLRQSLLKAQNRMKQQAFEAHSEVGAVAYRLDLPSDALIHPVFHVSLLKEADGSPTKIIPIPEEARFCLRPSVIQDRKLVKRKNRAAMKVLVQWKDQSEQDATWEFLDELQLRFPDFSATVALRTHPSTSSPENLGKSILPIRMDLLFLVSAPLVLKADSEPPPSPLPEPVFSVTTFKIASCCFESADNVAWISVIALSCDLRALSISWFRVVIVLSEFRREIGTALIPLIRPFGGKRDGTKGKGFVLLERNNEGLPKVKGKDTIFLVVDRLTKYAHFVLLGHLFSAKDVAQVFIDNIYKLHGCPNLIISDRDPIFLSSFWTKFLNLQGVSAKLSTAYHPQTDGQTEVVNRCLEVYLRCIVMEGPFTWTKWLSLAEWWYNTSFHSSLGRTPFEALYGYRPPLHIPYIPRDVADQDVDELMRYREAAIKVLRQSLLKAQNRMKQQAFEAHSEVLWKIR